MADIYADAHPRKRFFLEMFTRDIALEDCILDLVDNSIDSLVETRNLDLAGAPFAEHLEAPTELPFVNIQLSQDHVSILDNCGGIPREEAIAETFNFGRPHQDINGTQPRLGAYGIGLKRAIFKIGRHVQMKSQTDKDGFSLDLDIDEWAKKDETLEDWRFPISPLPGTSQGKAGTSIEIRGLRPEVSMRIGDGSFINQLHSQLARTYAWFLERHIRVTINNCIVVPFDIPIGESNLTHAATDKFEDNGVDVFLFAGLAARGARGEWKAESAGWYVMCNGRVVVVANKDELTGWGGGALPSFVPKYRGFLGLAFFNSKDPLRLPWTTTKRGLNRESIVYQMARNRMRGLARPVLTFLDSLYPSDPPESREEREIAKAVQPADLAELARRSPSAWRVERPKKRVHRTTVKVQFDAEKEDLDRVRKRLRAPGMPANQIGKYTFDFYLQMEGLK